MLTDFLVTLLGVIFAGAGGELFLRGVVGLARGLRVPVGIVGATVAAFATSSPELAVAVRAGLAGTPQIALGDATGSNIVNVGLILGLALVLLPIGVPRDSLTRDFPIALLAPLATLILALDGQISRIDGGVLLCFFVVWLVATIREARRQRGVEGEAPPPLLASGAFSVAGLSALVAAGHLVVTGASALAARAGLAPYVIGATVVAFGTSVPELAAVILASRRGHQEVGLGTVLGSNIFNGLFIVGVTAMLAPIRVDVTGVGAALGVGALLVGASFPPGSGLLDRRRGALLLALYVVFVAAILQFRPAGAAP